MKFDGRYIAGLLENDHDAVGKVIRAIRINERILLSQGFGVQEKGIPLRFLAYIIPTLHLVLPTPAMLLPSTTPIEFYFATHGVLRANGYENKTLVLQNAYEMGTLIRNYVEGVHSHLTNNISILFDRPISVGSDIDLLFEILVRKLENYYSYTWRREEQRAVQSFLSKKGRRLRYMVEHASYMRDPLRSFDVNSMDWQLITSRIKDFDHIIMVGGPAEKIFHIVRERLKKLEGIHNHWMSHQFFTAIGDPPTYYLQVGEPTWGERKELPEDVCDALYQIAQSTIHDFGTNTKVVTDILILLADAGGLHDFPEVIRQRRKIIRGEKIPHLLNMSLQKGWEYLRNRMY